MEQDEEGVVIDACANCRFYKTDYYEADEVTYERTYGVCCRMPPKRIDGSYSAFPIVEDDWWCGEYKKNLSDVSNNFLS